MLADGDRLLLEPGEVEAIGEALAGAVAVAEMFGGRALPRVMLLREIVTALLVLAHIEHPPLYVLAPTDPEEARAYAAELFTRQEP